MPSLVQSSSSCCMIVVSGTIIIVVEPWNIIWSNERRFLWGSERHDSLLFMLKKTQHTWWEEAASDDHRQCLAHTGWHAAKVHRDLRCKLSLSQKAFLCRSWRVCWLEDSPSVKLLVPACYCFLCQEVILKLFSLDLCVISFLIGCRVF